MQTEMGQLLDMTTEAPGGGLDFSRFTIEVRPSRAGRSSPWRPATRRRRIREGAAKEAQGCPMVDQRQHQPARRRASSSASWILCQLDPLDLRARSSLHASPHKTACCCRPRSAPVLAPPVGVKRPLRPRTRGSGTSSLSNTRRPSTPSTCPSPPGSSSPVPPPPRPAAAARRVSAGCRVLRRTLMAGSRWAGAACPRVEGCGRAAGGGVKGLVLLAGLEGEAGLDEARAVCLALGEYFQIQASSAARLGCAQRRWAPGRRLALMGDQLQIRAKSCAKRAAELGWATSCRFPPRPRGGGAFDGSEGLAWPGPGGRVEACLPGVPWMRPERGAGEERS